MKFAAIIVLALIAAVYSAPTSVSDNNIGNIVNVDVSGSVDIDNTVNTDIVSVIIKLMNQQALLVASRGGDDDDDGVPTPSKVPKLSPEMINKLKSMMAKK